MISKNTKKNRMQLVVKSNDLLKKTKFNLTKQEQKIILTLISKIKPNDDKFTEYEFSIQEYCDLVNIDNSSGGNYSYIKKSLEKLLSKVFWLETETKLISVRWLDRAIIEKDSGIVKLKLDEYLKPFLLQLKDNFTQYQLERILPMKSQYSIRLYEFFKCDIWKSYGVDDDNNPIRRKIQVKFEISRLQEQLMCKYKMTKDFKVRVIEPAITEINKFTEIEVSYRFIKTIRKFTHIEFIIQEKMGADKLLEAMDARTEVLGEPTIEQLDGQMMMDF